MRINFRKMMVPAIISLIQNGAGIFNDETTHEKTSEGNEGNNNAMREFIAEQLGEEETLPEIKRHTRYVEGMLKSDSTNTTRFISKELHGNQSTFTSAFFKNSGNGKRWWSAKKEY